MERCWARRVGNNPCTRGRAPTPVSLACRIHEGTVFSNRDHRTLLDKMILLLDSMKLNQPFYFVADAYYVAAGSNWQETRLIGIIGAFRASALARGDPFVVG